MNTFSLVALASVIVVTAACANLAGPEAVARVRLHLDAGTCMGMPLAVVLDDVVVSNQMAWAHDTLTFSVTPGHHSLMAIEAVPLEAYEWPSWPVTVLPGQTYTATLRCTPVQLAPQA